jgi:protein phosphatase
MRGAIDWYGQSDQGRRDSNEDEFLIAGLNKSMLIHQTSLDHEAHTRLFGGSQGYLLAVADGMGGVPGGRRASTLAIDALTRYVLNTSSWFFNLREGQEDDLVDELAAALHRCQETIEQAAARSGREGMGTTLTLAYIIWPRLYVVHVGDSRCYLRRGVRLEQITRDQTMAQRLVEAGALTPEQAEGSRWSHVLWSCLGGSGEAHLEPEVFKTTLQIGDTLLLCTDGLSGALSDGQILAALREEVPARQTCELLVRSAGLAGSKDNITAVVAHFRDAEQQRQAAQQASRAVPVAAPASQAEAVPAG